MRGRREDNGKKRMGEHREVMGDGRTDDGIKERRRHGH